MRVPPLLPILKAPSGKIRRAELQQDHRDTLDEEENETAYIFPSVPQQPGLEVGHTDPQLPIQSNIL